jgi:2'-5' RNA ligase
MRRRLARHLPYIGAMADSTLRLFFALWPDPTTRAALAGLAGQVAGETGGRATAPDNVHVTLVFLGARPRGNVAELVDRARGIKSSPFVLTLDRIDCWRKNGIVWLGATEIPPALALLRTSLVAAIAPLGVADDPRHFAVHVTLARKITTALHRPLSSPIIWPVDALTLVASDTAAEGPVYRVVASLPLDAKR